MVIAANCFPLLIQQKVDRPKSDFFNRSWDEFKVGFNDTSGNYWIGNELLSQLTLSGRYKLRFGLHAYPNNSWYYAEYSAFIVYGESRYWCPSTRAMLAMLWLTTTGCRSPPMTATTIRGSTVATTTTAQCGTEADSGTIDPAACAVSTVSVDMASDGIHNSINCSICRHLACGSHARSHQCSYVIASLSPSLSPSPPNSSPRAAQNQGSNQCSENRHQ